MASSLFAKTFKTLMTGSGVTVDFDTDTFNCALVKLAGWTPQFDTDSKYSDIDSELPATGNYVLGGETLTGVALTQTSDGSATITFDAADVSWTTSTLTDVRAGVVYSKTVNDDNVANDSLIAYIDFLGDFSTTSGTFQIQWNPSGIFTLDLKP
tara:strand:+ start:620 stop:1081 length:462 start_codon:yes stop_codon:yes gene_type:complete